MILESLRRSGVDFFVMYATSANPDLFYVSRIKLYDPAIYLVGTDGTELLVVPKIEKRRVGLASRVKEIASFEDLGYKEKVREVGPKKAISEILVSLLKEGRCRKVLLPDDFPAFLAVELSNHFEIKFGNPIRELRSIKTKAEVEKIVEVSNAILLTFNWLIKNFKFKKCEEIRNAIESKLLSMGYLAENTISSSGKISADPHEIGHGEVFDHVLIDIFPKSLKTNYYSDFTRTVFVKDNKDLFEMYEAVVEAQSKAIGKIRDGVDGRDVHETVKATLEDYGYKTTSEEGFLHSTGHGIGLELHEDPRIGDQSVTLKSGMVVTVEPGLYYKDVGGVRVEDVVLVKRDSCEVLTNFPKFIRI